MINVNRKGEVWVFAEQHGGKLEDIPLELMSKARHLAGILGVQLAAVLLGSNCKTIAKKLIQYGSDKVYLAEHPLLEHYQTNSYAKVIYDLIHKYEPQIVIYGASVTGRDLAPRVASAAKAGLTADCTDLQIGDHTSAKDGVTHSNLLVPGQTRVRRKHNRDHYQLRPLAANGNGARGRYADACAGHYSKGPNNC